MPGGDDSEKTLSQHVNDTRGSLLQTLKAQLDELVIEQLTPQPEGIPYINFETDPPQIAALKRVMNSLFYTEEAFKQWERIDSSTYWKKVKSIRELFNALKLLYTALGLLDDASPEIRRIVSDNYNLFEPVFTQAHALIQDYGWSSQFMSLERTEKASKVIIEGIDLLGPDYEKSNQGHPLISTFTKLSALIETFSSLQNKDITSEDERNAVASIRVLLNDLQRNAFINKLSISHFEDAKAIQDLLAWFHNIEEDGFAFTQKSLRQYVSWANHYLPLLMTMADQLERQNYLKPGMLSARLSATLEDLSIQVNEFLSDPGFAIDERLITPEALRQIRTQGIDASQRDCVKNIIAIEDQLQAASAFYRILEPYKEMALTQITESDRVLLRQIYPKIQMALAHSELEFTNQLGMLINTMGPENPENKPRSWWQMAEDGLSYVTNLLTHFEAEALLEAEPKVKGFILNQRASETFKIMISEKARALLEGNKDSSTPQQLQVNVEKRIAAIKSGQVPAPVQALVSPFTPVKPSDLSNLHGTLSALQELKLSKTISDTRSVLNTVIQQRISNTYRPYFSEPPYEIKENEPLLVVQIKTVENKLSELNIALQNFETMTVDYGVIIQLRQYIALARSATQLKQAVNVLSPEAQKILAPVLESLMAYGLSLSKVDYKEVDLSALQHIKETYSPPVEHIAKLELSDYIKQISQTRSALLDTFKIRLSPALTESLVPQTEGVPFINLANDPPQTAAIKKIINSMYHAECALKIWHGMNTDNALGKIAAAHQGVAALSQVYKSFALVTQASAEIQNVARDNSDLIEPLIQGANTLIKRSGWLGQFTAPDIAERAGSLLGQTITSFQSNSDTTQTASLISLLAELPVLMNALSTTMSSESEREFDELKISNQSINAMSAVLELVFEENASMANALKGLTAISGFIDLYKKIQHEGMSLQETTLQFYQRWLKEGYPNLILMLDEIETRHYMAPGYLSAPIALELDQINNKLNEVIENKQNSRLKIVPLSFDLGKARQHQLITQKTAYWFELFQIEEQQKAARLFFARLAPYADKSMLTMAPAERVALRLDFAEIQLALANSNLDLANEVVTILNRLETAPEAASDKLHIPVAQLLRYENAVHHYLNENSKSYQLKIAVVNNAQSYVKSKSFESFDIEEPDAAELEQRFMEAQRQKTTLGHGELRPIQSSSLNSVRGNLAALQELQFSSAVTQMREQFSQLTQHHLSSRIHNYLIKQPGQSGHIIDGSDPSMVRQIKECENGLYHLETAMLHFESMKKGDTLIAQAKAVVEIAYHARQLNRSVQSLCPELKGHYGPLIETLVDFSKKIQSINYNKEDWADLQFILNRAHKELLTTNKPRKPHIAKAFFDAGVREIPVNINTSETATHKAIKLGVKYTHIVSPQFEQARRYLDRRYENVFGAQPLIIRTFTRDQLANDAFMESEFHRITELLEKNYGFNITTVKVLHDLIRQIQRMGAQAGELSTMANTLVTENFAKIKENTYKDLLTKLSQEEDYLCLKPGTLLNPAMAVVNQLFLSAVLELDMHFDKKLAILHDSAYTDIILKQSQQELAALEKQLSKEPENHDVAFSMSIKADKIIFLQQQMAVFKENDLIQTRNALMEMQFEVSLKNHLLSTMLKLPIVKQYERSLRDYYLKQHTQLTSEEDYSHRLQEMIAEFEKQHLADYLIVYEAYDRLHKFAAKLPQEHQDIKDYIDEINASLVKEGNPIAERAHKVRSLPTDSLFIKKLSSFDSGISFLNKFKQFIQIITSSIAEAITTGANLISLYRQKRMEQSLKNIEQSKFFKENTPHQDKPKEPDDEIEGKKLMT